MPRNSFFRVPETPSLILYPQMGILIFKPVIVNYSVSVEKVDCIYCRFSFLSGWLMTADVSSLECYWQWACLVSFCQLDTNCSLLQWSVVSIRMAWVIPWCIFLINVWYWRAQGTVGGAISVSWASHGEECSSIVSASSSCFQIPSLTYPNNRLTHKPNKPHPPVCGFGQCFIAPTESNLGQSTRSQMMSVIIYLFCFFEWCSPTPPRAWEGVLLLVLQQNTRIQIPSL